MTSNSGSKDGEICGGVCISEAIRLQCSIALCDSCSVLEIFSSLKKCRQVHRPHGVKEIEKHNLSKTFLVASEKEVCTALQE